MIICGQSTNNKSVLGQQIEGGPRTKHGGNDHADNNGVLSYVRVEFAGYPFQKDKEIYGITFGSVGNDTQVDHILVSYTNDDSYEWFTANISWFIMIGTMSLILTTASAVRCSSPFLPAILALQTLHSRMEGTARQPTRQQHR